MHLHNDKKERGIEKEKEQGNEHINETIIARSRDDRRIHFPWF